VAFDRNSAFLCNWNGELTASTQQVSGDGELIGFEESCRILSFFPPSADGDWLGLLPAIG